MLQAIVLLLCCVSCDKCVGCTVDNGLAKSFGMGVASCVKWDGYNAMLPQCVCVHICVCDESSDSICRGVAMTIAAACVQS